MSTHLSYSAYGIYISYVIALNGVLLVLQIIEMSTVTYPSQHTHKRFSHHHIHLMMSQDLYAQRDECSGPVARVYR